MAQVTSGSFETNRYTGSAGNKGLKFEWSRTSTNIENNYSTIHWTLKGVGTSSYYHELRNCYLNINGTRVYTQPTSGNGAVIKLSSGTKVAEGNFDIPHEGDGTKTFGADGGGGVYTSAVNCTGSGSWELESIPRSSYADNVSNTTIGTTLTATLVKYSNSFTHNVFLTAGNKTQSLNVSGTTISGTVDMDFCNQIPTADNINAFIGVETFNNGQKIGDTIYSGLKLYIPSDSVFPSISSVSKSDTANLLSSYGAYVQGKSDLRIITNASGSYSSWITNYTVNIKDSNNNLLRQLSGNDVTLWDISYTGAVIYVEAIVTDSRGRQASNTSQISCCEYWNPKIYSFTAERRNNDSTVTLTWNAEVLNVNAANVNGKTFNIYKRQKGSSVWGTAIISYNSGYTWSRNDFTTSCDENYGWEFLLEVIDNFTSTYYQVEVGTAFELINWGADGTSMAIGKVSEHSNTLEVGLDTEFNGDLYNTALDLFDDTSGNDWQEMMRNKIDYCITNMNTNKENASMFINGGWNGITYGFGLFSKIGTVFQLVWQSNLGIYYCRKHSYGTSGTYSYNRLTSDDTGWQDCSLTSDFERVNWSPLRYRKRNDVVNVTGAVSVVNNPTSWGKTITTLPAGYRPVGEVDVVCRTTWSQVIKIVVSEDGSIFTLNLNDGNDLSVGEYILINVTYLAA